MKRFFSIAIVLSLGLLIFSCSDTRRRTGAAYMPDMAYSRALETYSLLDSSRFTSDSNARGKGKYFYNASPVKGTIAIGDVYSFHYAKDQGADTTNYIASKQAQNPFPTLSADEMKEAERLYLVNCGICHGPKLDGNGPLYNNGKGPFPAAPRNLVTYVIPEGQMFYAVTYGKGNMGSYASQITTKQRWMIIDFVKSKQGGAAGTVAKDSTAANGAKDSTATKK